MATNPLTAPKVEPKVVEHFEYVAVHGRIQHPYTLTWFKQDKEVPHVLDAWIQAQLDGGKLKHKD